MRFVVSGRSMEPAFSSGQILLVSFLPYLFQSPKIRDVVVMKDPRNGKFLLKRIIQINQEKYFVEGDNKKESTDSRVFGLLDKKNIVGKVLL